LSGAGIRRELPLIHKAFRSIASRCVSLRFANSTGKAHTKYQPHKIRLRQPPPGGFFVSAPNQIAETGQSSFAAAPRRGV